MFKIDVRRKVDFMRTLYEAIAERLKRVDFNEIWTGFHPFEFALYNSQHIALSNCDLPWNEKFVGNTAIQYEGKYIAIWNIEDYHNTKIDPNELAADLVHEMFHAYQMTLGETRFPDDLLMLCVIILVKELGWSIAHTIGKEEKSVFEIICEKRHGCKKSDGNTGLMTDIHDSDLTEPERIEAMKQLLEQLKYEQRQIIKKFQEKELHKITGEFRICGYDPMNLFYIDGFLYCSTFMAISDDDYKNEKRLFGESLMELIPSTYNKVSCYSYIK